MNNSDEENSEHRIVNNLKLKGGSSLVNFSPPFKNIRSAEKLPLCRSFDDYFSLTQIKIGYPSNYEIDEAYVALNQDILIIHLKN